MSTPEPAPAGLQLVAVDETVVCEGDACYLPPPVTTDEADEARGLRR